MTPATLAFRLGKVARTARTYLFMHDTLGPMHAATRCAGFAYDANVSAALRRGATLTDVAVASAITPPDDIWPAMGEDPELDDLAEVRAALDEPIDLAGVA